MDDYRKTGYLHTNYKIFHLVDNNKKEIPYHYHDFNKILIFLAGDVTYHIEGRSYDLMRNDIVFVNAGEVHRPIINSCCTYERIVIYVSPEFLYSYRKESYDLGNCFERAHKEESHVLRVKSFSNSRLCSAIHAMEASISDEDYACELYHEILFLEFMIELNRAAIHDDISYISNTASNKTILAVLDYLNCHLTEDLNIDQLAEHFFLNRYYLMHSFKEETGYTIGNYLSTKRLLLAKDLIQSGKTITEVCYECGYKNYSTFSRAYKKCFGEAPREACAARHTR